MFCDCNIDARVSWQECSNEIRYLRQTQLIGEGGRLVLFRQTFLIVRVPFSQHLKFRIQLARRPFFRQLGRFVLRNVYQPICYVKSHNYGSWLCTLDVVHGSRDDRIFMYFERFYLRNVWIEFKQVQ